MSGSNEVFSLMRIILYFKKNFKVAHSGMNSGMNAKSK